MKILCNSNNSYGDIRMKWGIQTVSKLGIVWAVKIIEINSCKRIDVRPSVVEINFDSCLNDITVETARDI